MTTYTNEYTSYPVEITIFNIDPAGPHKKVSKGRITFRNGVVGVYDANAPEPYVFTEILLESIEGQAQRFGNEFEVTLFDGRIVRASAPQGCGCGDIGKRYLFPPDTGGVVFYPE
jgi:hypothetical protein